MHSVQNTGGRPEKTPSPLTDNTDASFTLIAQIYVEVKFGVVSRNCDNYGVCHIDSVEYLFKNENQKMSICARKTTAIFSVCRNGGIELAFPKSALKAETQRMFFSQPFFTVEEDFELSGELTEQFNLDNKPKIIRGEYEIIETTGFYVVNFLKK